MSQKQLTRILLTCLVITSFFHLMGATDRPGGATLAITMIPPENDTLGVYLPNAFSPNEDGVNDDFGPFFRRDLPIEAYQFQVYDRWGTQLFLSDNPNDRWNGTYHGETAEAGAYAYVLAFSFAGETRPGQRILRGKINLVR